MAVCHCWLAQQCNPRHTLAANSLLKLANDRPQLPWPILILDKSIKLCYSYVCRNRHSLFGNSTISQSVLFERSCVTGARTSQHSPWLAELFTICHACVLVDDITPALQAARNRDDA